MDVTRSEFQDLVGAYALDAATPTRRRRSTRTSPSTPTRPPRPSACATSRRGSARSVRCTRRSRCATVCSPRPPSASIRSRRSTRLRRETERFEALLDSLEPGRPRRRDLQRPDRARSRRARRDRRRGVRRPAAASGPHVVVHRRRRGRADDRSRSCPRSADWSFAQIRDRFRAGAPSAGRPRRAAARRRRRSAATRCTSVLVIRAFETWTHHHDIAAVLGRAEAPVDAPVLRTMAELAVQTLPLALAAKGYEYPGPHRAGRDERSRWRRLDDRVHAPASRWARFPTSCSGSRWSSSAGGSPTGSRSTTCRSRSTATPSSGAPWSTPRPPSPGCKSLHSTLCAGRGRPRRCRTPSGPERLRVDACEARPKGHDQLDEAFWLSHLRVGFGVFVGEALAVLVYLRASPAEAAPRRARRASRSRAACVGAALVLRAAHDRSSNRGA